MLCASREVRNTSVLFCTEYEYHASRSRYRLIDCHSTPHSGPITRVEAAEMRQAIATIRDDLKRHSFPLRKMQDGQESFEILRYPSVVSFEHNFLSRVGDAPRKSSYFLPSKGSAAASSTKPGAGVTAKIDLGGAKAAVDEL